MKNLEAFRYKQKLDNLFRQVSSLPVDDKLQSEWAKYLCVLASGFLEVSICAIYNRFARQSSSPYVANFVQYELNNFQNPKMGKIIGLTKAFNPQWANELETATEGEIKEAVDSIVANKNNIAHGRDVGITYTRIKNYYKNAVKVVDLIEKMCGI